MIVPVEKIWKKFNNKYKAINVASLEARRLKDAQSKGLIQEKFNPVLESIRKLITGKIAYKE
jgi:DNA-directed RNA polymerase subunit K/omega